MEREPGLLERNHWLSKQLSRTQKLPNYKESCSPSLLVIADSFTDSTGEADHSLWGPRFPGNLCKDGSGLSQPVEAATEPVWLTPASELPGLGRPAPSARCEGSESGGSHSLRGLGLFSVAVEEAG